MDGCIPLMCVETPFFMTVGTAGAVKGITPEQLRRAGTEVVLANTYHLFLRPGVEAVENWEGCTDLWRGTGRYLPTAGVIRCFR